MQAAGLLFLAFILVALAVCGIVKLVRMMIETNRQVRVLRADLLAMQDERQQKRPREKAKKPELRRLVNELSQLLVTDHEADRIESECLRVITLLESAHDAPPDIAEGLYREALAESEGTAGSTHWLTAVVLNDLASFLYETGESEEAWEKIRLAVQVAAEWGEENCALRSTISYNLVTMIMVIA